MTVYKKLRPEHISISITAIIAALVYIFVSEPHPRFFYSSWDLTELKYERTSRIIGGYTQARKMQAKWTRDPKEVGEWLSRGGNNFGCAPEIECSKPTKISLYSSDENHVTVIVLEDPVSGDDSINGEEDRIDLRRGEDGAWDVEWGGSRWKCDPSRSGGFGWWRRFQLCS